MSEKELDRLHNLTQVLVFELIQTNRDLVETLAKFGAEPHDFHRQQVENRINRLKTLHIKKP